MMIAVVGTRGFPNVQGGVERHCEELYSRLAAHGVEVLVFTRSPYVRTASRWSLWRGILLRKVWTPQQKSLEAIWHSIAALILARLAGIRAVHIHATGPGLVVPLARLLGFQVFFTHHGCDYMRDKWGAVAKMALRAGERWAVRYAHQVLAVSHEIESRVATEFGRTAVYAPNGISVEEHTDAQVDKTLASFGLRPQTYAITVARLVPEKGIHDLLEAIAQASEIPRLVVVGDADHHSPYAEKLKARLPGKALFVGGQLHETTLDLVRGARVFSLPSYHEGLPIALLEALACQTPVVASNIGPHREIITPGVHGWLTSPGNIAELRAALQEAWLLDEEQRQILTTRGAETVAERFSWDTSVRLLHTIYGDGGGHVGILHTKGKQVSM
jgi:starch synthase